MKIKTYLTLAVLTAALALSGCETMRTSNSSQPSAVRDSSLNNKAGTAGAAQPAGNPR